MSTKIFMVGRKVSANNLFGEKLMEAIVSESALVQWRRVFTAGWKVLACTLVLRRSS